MNDFKVSIVMPVYNTPEPLLQRSIDSILVQTYQDFELVLVDDGSTDEVCKCIDRIGTGNDKIRIFHIKNEGVSHARNFGVDQASGDYVMFADSDDYVSPLMIEQALEAVVYYNADIVYGAVMRVPESIGLRFVKQEKPKIRLLDKEGVKSLREHLLDVSNDRFIYSGGSLINRGSNSRIIRTELARDISFPEDIEWGEDVIWNQRLFGKVQKIAVSEHVWYYYVQRVDSVTHGYDAKHPDRLRKLFLCLTKEILTDHPEMQRNYDVMLLQYFAILMYDNCVDLPGIKTMRKRHEILKGLLREEPFDRLMICPWYKNMKMYQKLFFMSVRIPGGLYAYYIFEYIKQIINRFRYRLIALSNS